MTEKNKGTEKVAVALLLLAVIVQVITFAFLWNPEKFRETVQRFKDALKKGADKTKSVFSKKEDEKQKS